MTTAIIASGPGWTLRRDDNEPAVLDITDPCYETMEFPGRRELGVQLPEDLVARIARVPTPTHAETETGHEA
jgi:hypothetical protein